MQKKFEKYIIEKKLLVHGQSVLAAVSGGIDSMVMLHLLTSCGLSVGVAHCNFNLRGNESDGDATFVAEHASAMGLKFHEASFDTKDYAGQQKVSIQMAARDLRYNWLKDICLSEGYDSIATGHNLNDAVETFFINLIRGSGIQGLTGIAARSGNIVRPILFATREEIAGYAAVQNILFRNDSSNEETKYTRNKIRHNIIPLFNQLNPSFLQTMAANMDILDESAKLLFGELDKKGTGLVAAEGNLRRIDLKKLGAYENIKLLLYYLISPFGFSAGQLSDILHALGSPSGKTFYSGTHRLVRDRNHLILDRPEEGFSPELQLDSSEFAIEQPIYLTAEKVSLPLSGLKQTESHTALLDLDRLNFPLTLRQWKKGDRFIPLGMQQFKKLSDFFNDIKLSIPEKERTWLLVAGNNIAWVIGHRIDDRFKIIDSSRLALRITCHEKNKSISLNQVE